VFGADVEARFSAILIGRIDDFYQHVGDLFAWSEEKLVRYAGGDVEMTSPALTAILVPPLIPLPCISLGAVVCGSITRPPYTKVASPLWTIMTSAFV
jgi:hypothetical protein